MAIFLIFVLLIAIGYLMFNIKDFIDIVIIFGLLCLLMHINTYVY
mgnify:CR=1 FL=1|jgi:hypothetical protein